MLNLMDFHKDNLKVGMYAPPGSALGKARVSGGQLTTTNGGGIWITTSAGDMADGIYASFGKDWIPCRDTIFDGGRWDAPAVAAQVTLSVNEAMPILRRAAACADGKDLKLGVCFDVREGGLRLVATDNFRLSVAPVEAAGLEGIPTGKYTVPSKAVAIILKDKKTASLRFGVSLRESPSPWQSAVTTVLETDNVRVCADTPNGTFPEYDWVIPDWFVIVLRVPRKVLVESLEALSPYLKASGKVEIPMPPVFTDERSWGLELIAEHPVGGKKTVTIPATRETIGNKPQDCTIIMPCRYNAGKAPKDRMILDASFLLDALRYEAGEYVRIGMNDALKPIAVYKA